MIVKTAEMSIKIAAVALLSLVSSNAYAEKMYRWCDTEECKTAPAGGKKRDNWWNIEFKSADQDNNGSPTIRLTNDWYNTENGAINRSRFLQQHKWKIGKKIYTLASCWANSNYIDSKAKHQWVAKCMMVELK